MGLRKTLLLVTLGLGACADQGRPPTVVDIEAPAAARRLRIGDVHRYAFSWRVDSTASNGMLGELPSTGGIDLAGELVLQVVAETDAGTTVAVRFTRLDTHRVETFGANTLGDPSVLLGRDAMVVVPADGDVRRVLFAPDAPSVFRHLMGGLLAHVDLRRGPTDTPWRAEIATGNGLAEVEYTARSSDTFSRKIARYTRVDAIRGHGDGPWRTEGDATVVIGDDGMPTHIESDELLVLAGSESGMSFDGRTQVTLTRTATEHGDVVAPPSVLGWREQDLHAVPDDTEAQRELARKFAEGMTMTELSIAVRSAAVGLRPSPGFHVRARGLLRGWPELAGELGPMFEGAPDHRTRAFMLDLLVSADTPEAQAVIVGLLDRTPRADDVASLLQHLGLLRTPTPALAAMVVDMHRTAGGDDTLRRAALYPMGSLAPAIAASDPVLGAVMMSTIRDAAQSAVSPDDRMAAIAALGNAGFAEDAPIVLGAVDDADASVRTDAVTALRRFRGDGPDDALFAALLDPEQIVAAAALAVIEGYRRDEVTLARLAAQVTAGGHHPELRGGLISVLAKHGLEDERARAALVAMAGRSGDAREQVRIRRILGRA